jgi:quercetin dioxygenase-like cupin family protein
VKIKRRDEVSAVAVVGYAGVAKQIVLGPAGGSNEIVLRYFSVDKDGATPRHSHDFPHLVRVERGRGLAVDAAGNENQLAPGDYIYVEPNEVHNFKNTGTEPFEFICIVPARGEQDVPLPGTGVEGY